LPELNLSLQARKTGNNLRGQEIEWSVELTSIESDPLKVTEKDVAYVADLANLELTDEERAGMLRDLNSILDYVDLLGQLDTSNVPPMAQVSDRYGVDESKQGSERFAYASREDVLEGLRKSLPRQESLANAPDADEDFFRVPKVIER
jgi:aspartyl-tRNA(Asn)/glutamyl-tRNA(Gln) amidotransferase subunit C